MASVAQRNAASQSDALLWPVAEAAAASFNARQVDCDAPTPSPPEASDFNTLFVSVAGGIFADIEAKAPFWQRSRGPAVAMREIAPALSTLDVMSYWLVVRKRFENPMIDHRLAQIAEDGSLKLPQRLFPLLEANARTGKAIGRMAEVVRAWLDLMATRPSRDPANGWLADWARAGADKAKALDNPVLFPDIFRTNARLRAAILAK